jgi:hypothetical protein
MLAVDSQPEETRMARKFLGKLTYANVISSLALFLVLTGGTAIALSGTNTVFSDDIVNGAVKGADVAEDTLGEVPKALQASRLGQSATETTVEEYYMPRVTIPAVMAPGTTDKDLLTPEQEANHFGGGYYCPPNPATSTGLLTFKNTQVVNPDGNQAYNVWIEQSSAALQFRRLSPGQQFSLSVQPLDVVTITYDDLRQQQSAVYATLTGAYAIAKFVVRHTSSGCIVRLHHIHYK